MDRLINAGVAGWPVGHSLSPVIHAWWRREHGITGHYEHLPCETEDDFRNTVARCRARHFAGLNVTIPHKAAALAVADEVSDVARDLGVANTLSFSDDRLYADNTDVTGFEDALRAVLPQGGKHTRALVVGAGGAAPAVCLALSRCGFKNISVTNRTAARAADLAKRFDFVSAVIPWDSFRDGIGDYDLVVNTTALGMKGKEPLEVNFSDSPDHQIVADIVYTPAETPFLAAARARGLVAFNGLAMLAHQAVPGFERWTGIRPEVTAALMDHLEARLRGEAPVVIIGITGSIGMGKSTVAGMFSKLGAARWDADEAVHRLYSAGGDAVGPVADAFPEMIEANAISREKLGLWLRNHPDDFPKLEAIVHPLVHADREAFLKTARQSGALGCVLDIPLLYETGLESQVDCTVVVTANSAKQRDRVLARPGMTEAKFDAILKLQTPDAEKRQRADYIIDTGVSLDETRAQAATVYDEILKKFSGV